MPSAVIKSTTYDGTSVGGIFGSGGCGACGGAGACATFAAACILGALGSIWGGVAMAADLVILTNQGATPGVKELAAAFSRASGHKVSVIQADDAVLQQRLNDGTADLITGNPGPID